MPTGIIEPAADARSVSDTTLRLMLLAALALWATGLAMHAARFGSALVRLARVRRHAVEWTDNGLSAMRTSASGAVGLRRAPDVLLSPHADLLATWGIVHPRVVLPMQAASWPDERVVVVLTHEFAHSRRRDWVLQLVAEIVRCMHWYNPLVWLVCRRLRHESERACVRSGVHGPWQCPWRNPQVSKGELRPC